MSDNRTSAFKFNKFKKLVSFCIWVKRGIDGVDKNELLFNECLRVLVSGFEQKEGSDFFETFLSGLFLENVYSINLIYF